MIASLVLSLLAQYAFWVHKKPRNRVYNTQANITRKVPSFAFKPLGAAALVFMLTFSQASFSEPTSSANDTLRLSTAPMSYTEAVTTLRQNADRLRMANANVSRAEAQSKGARWLGGPRVDLNAKQVWGTKTIDLGMDTGIGAAVQKGLQTLGAIGQKNPQLGQALGPVLQGAEAAAQRLNHIEIHRKMDLSGPRVSLDAVWPIYTGGLITAKQEQLRYAVDEARADRDQDQTTLEAQMAGRYWGVQLAENLVKLRASILKDQDEAVRRAEAFKKRGIISKVEFLAVKVSRDNAYTDWMNAKTHLEVAKNQLQTSLRLETLPPLTTPLFIIRGDLGTLADWKAKAAAYSPMLAKTTSLHNQANQAVKAAEAAYKPKVFAFGTKNLIKHYLTLPEPDWMAGIGVSFTLWDNLDRSQNVVAAQSLVDKALAAQSEARHGVEEAVETAWLQMNEARQAYELTETTLLLAKENLKLRSAAFAQGLSTATDLDNARTKVTGAELARRAAAFKFVMNLVMLHAASGTMMDLPQDLNRNDIVYVH